MGSMRFSAAAKNATLDYKSTTVQTTAHPLFPLSYPSFLLSFLSFPFLFVSFVYNRIFVVSPNVWLNSVTWRARGGELRIKQDKSKLIGTHKF
jgi:hypothetical protein